MNAPPLSVARSITSVTVVWLTFCLGPSHAYGRDFPYGQSSSGDVNGMTQVTPVAELMMELEHRDGLRDTSLGDTGLRDISISDVIVNHADAPHGAERSLGLRDVELSAWAYSALESLIERYQLPLGFPDGTYRGDRPLTRYELVAAMLFVLNTLRDEILTGQTNLVSFADLQLIESLQTDFERILAESQDRLARLEPRVQTLEEQTFSTTTMLEGNAVLALADGYGNSAQPVGQYQVWLDLVTHFSEHDALRTRLMASDGDSISGASLGVASSALSGLNVSDLNASQPSVVNQTAEGTLIQHSRGNTSSSLELDWLTYSRSFAPAANLYLSAKGGTHAHYLDTLSPFGNGPFGNGMWGNGAISVFGQSSPIYTIGGGTGVGGEWVVDAGGKMTLSAGYLADQTAARTVNRIGALSESQAENQTGEPRTRVFNRDYAALAQLTLRPTSALALGLTYVHGYHTPNNPIFDAGLGTGAIAGTGLANGVHSHLETAAVTNSYSVQTTLELNRQVSLYGFGGYTDIRLIDQGDGDLWFYGVGLAVQDWLFPQTFGGIIIGAEPYLGSLDHPSLTIDTDTPLHVEAFYTLQLSDQLSFSPGVVWLTAPNQNRDNGDRVIATLRTTFQF